MPGYIPANSVVTVLPRMIPPAARVNATHAASHAGRWPAYTGVPYAVGMRVRAHAELIRVEKRTLTFRVQAEDEKERIGEGLHERIIINLERFDARMQEKLDLIGKS